MTGHFYQVSPYRPDVGRRELLPRGLRLRRRGTIKHFRVDKMVDIMAADLPRDGKEAYAALDMAVYSRKLFGMFSGQERRVRMRFDNRLVGAVLDRLGRDVSLIPDGRDALFRQRRRGCQPAVFRVGLRLRRDGADHRPGGRRGADARAASGRRAAVWEGLTDKQVPGCGAAGDLLYFWMVS